MKCTDCYAEIRPVVAFDIDGTLGNYHQHFRDFASAYLNRPLPENPYSYMIEFNEWLGIPKDEYRRVKLAYRQGGMKRTMPVFPGAARLVRSVENMGAEVWYATTRPWHRLDNVDPDTRHWLERNGFPVNRLIYGEDKYEQLLDNVQRGRVVATLDDLEEQVRAAKKLGLPAIHRIFDHMYNHRFVSNPYVTNLEDARTLILERIDRWMISNSRRGTLPSSTRSATR